MRLAVGVGDYGRGNLAELEAYVGAADRLGVDIAWSAEGWGHDAVTVLAYLAARTERIRLGSGIMQISARTPVMIAMTALSLSDLSDGRFVLGLGASGPQVVEGLHGVPYANPLTRMRETVEICRLAFSGKRVRYEGRHHVLPLPGGEGKSLAVSHTPQQIPIYLATLGPAALAYTGEAADGWIGHSFSPDHPEALLGSIRQGAERAGRDASEIDLVAPVGVLIGEDVDGLCAQRKPGIAFNIGAMGSEKVNFYADAYRRAGYEDDVNAIQQLWFQKRRKEAVARVPDAMVTEFAAIGTQAMVLERLQKYRDVGVTTLSLRIEGETTAARIRLLEQAVDLARQL